MAFQSENMQKLLDFADFVVLVVAKDPKICAEDRNLLADALPIGLWPNTRFIIDKKLISIRIFRPPIATMSICPQDAPNLPLFDLFRHEILHGMGYGLIIDKTQKSHKKSEKYIWNTPKGPQMAIRHFLDFDDIALDSARKHFNCASLQGIEADGTRKNHLNEYIFGVIWRFRIQNF